MADEKEANQSGGGFPNLNNLLMVFLAGTLVITQVPFHETRPDKPDDGKASLEEVNARLWQDPFEAVNRHIEEENRYIEEKNGVDIRHHNHSIDLIGQYLKDNTDNFLPKTEVESNKKAHSENDHDQTSSNAESKTTPEDPSKNNKKDSLFNGEDKSNPIELNVLAVMVPGGPYFEDGENRRKVRYAVLSGFDAALRYMPDDPDHINYFEANENGNIDPESLPQGSKGETCQSKASDQTNRLLKPQKVVYEWMVYKPAVNGDKLSESPKGQPYDEKQGEAKNGNARHPPVLILWLNNDVFKDAPYTKLSRLFDKIRQCTSPSGSGNSRWNVRIIGPYDSETLQDMVYEMGTPKYQPPPSTQCKTDGKTPDLNMSFFSPNATVQDDDILKNPNQRKYETLHDYFEAQKIDFYRTTTSDQELAVAIKGELARRGIVAGKLNRVVLIGEWDTLYGWHLPNTFATELMKGAENEDGCLERKGGGPQKPDIIYKPEIQCVFRFSYLRGLDGEKPKSRDKADKSPDKAKAGDGERTTKEELEDADGDSQFDYVRRLAVQIEDMDQQIRKATENLSLHPVKAIGILGSDVYDKLLILEALHDKFPDSVFFTNGLDSRFLQPDKNQWARNMIMASPFGLELERNLQRDIPPFRDSAQTAFFLATEMALANIYPQPDMYEPGMLGKSCRKLLSPSTQKDLNESLKPSRLHEVGRTRLFDLSQRDWKNDACTDTDDHPGRRLHPAAYLSTESASDLSLAAVLGVVLTLLSFRQSRQFLGSPAGLWFTLLMAVICFTCPLYLHTATSEGSGAMSGLGLASIEGAMLIGGLYLAAMIAIAVKDDKASAEVEAETIRLGRSWCLPVSLVLVAATFTWLWYSVIPGGRLDNGEPYSLFEGVSMWPTEGLRLIALILAGYFIIEVCRFPSRLTARLEKNFKLDGLSQIRTRSLWLNAFSKRKHAGERRQNVLVFLHTVFDRIFGPPEPTGPNGKLQSELKSCAVLNDWLAWRSNWRRLTVGLVLGFAFYKFASDLFVMFGATKIPYRGDTMKMLDLLMMRGFLVPAFYFLLFLVVDAVWTVVGLVERSVSGEPEEPAQWPEETLEEFETRFRIKNKEAIGKWVNMRFIGELTKGIYGMIGYPLVVALLLVIARSSYFDNWVMPLAFKLTIGFSLVLLIFWDHRLKQAADAARNKTLKLLREMALRDRGAQKSTQNAENPTENGNTCEQLDRIISMIEKSDEVVYKSFIQRPLFLNTLLIVAAMMVDSVDYLSLASKLFK